MVPTGSKARKDRTAAIRTIVPNRCFNNLVRKPDMRERLDDLPWCGKHQ